MLWKMEQFSILEITSRLGSKNFHFKLPQQITNFKQQNIKITGLHIFKLQNQGTKSPDFRNSNSSPIAPSFPPHVQNSNRNSRINI